MSSSYALVSIRYFEEGNEQLESKHECKDSIAFKFDTILNYRLSQMLKLIAFKLFTCLSTSFMSLVLVTDVITISVFL